MGGDIYVVESTTTAGLEPRERSEFWSEHVTSYQCRMHYEYPRTDDFDGGTIRQHTDNHELVEYWSDEISYVRTARQVRQFPLDDYRLLLPLASDMVVRQGDRQTRLAPGAARLITWDAPVEGMQSRSMRGLIMAVSAHEVNSSLNRSSPVTVSLDLNRGLGRVVGGMLTTLARERDHLCASQFDAVCDRIVELLCMLAVGDDRPDAPRHLADVEATVRRFARDHAADPRLNGTTMARALGWSLRQVQLALQQAGTTPRDLIRQERLRLTRDRLQSPHYRHMSITEVAYASGFSAMSTFNPAFRQYFGVSPRELRHGHDLPAPEPGGATAPDAPSR